MGQTCRSPAYAGTEAVPIGFGVFAAIGVNMPKFYFDIEVLGLMQVSAEAKEFLDLTTAIAAANECAKEMAAEDVQRGDCPGLGSLLVRDDSGCIVHRISLTKQRS
jgi:hypothetical protein